MTRHSLHGLFLGLLLCCSTALAQDFSGPQIAPAGMQYAPPSAAIPPPPPVPTPPGQPVPPPPPPSPPPPGQAAWPPPAQPIQQPTTPYVPSDQSLSPPPGTYLVAPQPVYPQPVYPQPAPWLAAEASPGLGLIPGAGNPRWDVAVDALWLTRDTGGGIKLGFSEYNPNSHAHQAIRDDSLWTDDVLFPLEPGIRFQLTGRVTDRMAIEASAFGLQDWSVGRAIYGDPDGQTVLAHSRWMQMPDFDDSLGYTYGSQVANVELNQRFKLLSFDPYRAFSWLWGVRYFHLSDDLTLTGSDIYTGGLETLNWKTTNNLIGAQLGLQWAWGWDRFQLTTEAKIGLFANIYSQHGTDSVEGISGFDTFDMPHSGTDLSALFEFSIMLRYRVTQCMWLRAGYQYYGVTGLALGPRQLADFDSSGTVGLDGLSLGVELTR
jgi:hypothetical protein